jgi:hypothetical protein
MTAIGGHALAIKGANDFFHPRLSKCHAQSINFGSIITKLGIGIQDVCSCVALLGYGLGCVVVFKGAVTESLLSDLRQGGFTLISLPRNPYGT